MIAFTKLVPLSVVAGRGAAAAEISLVHGEWRPTIIAYMSRSCVLVFLAFLPAFSQSYTISTVAGNGVAGVSFYYPTSVAVDGGGNLYVSDWSGLIRKIWMREGAPTGVTAIAGIGTLGFGGDGGQATGAQIGRAIRLTLDSAGDLYFADGDNNRIRRIDRLSGVITTVAGNGSKVDSGDGGPALNAGVSQPTGIVVDAAGNLYFSSSWARVRRVAAATGRIETIAGQSINGFSGDNGPAINALFWDPIPSAISRGGDLYIADYENSRIRMIAFNTGIVTTVVGSGPCPNVPPFWITVCRGAFGGDGGLAQSAPLSYAGAVALDAAENLYIADTINHRIRRVDAVTGVINTIAGTGVEGFSGDGGPALAAAMHDPAHLAIDGSGRVYFCDEGNQRIRVLTPAIQQPAKLKQVSRR